MSKNLRKYFWNPKICANICTNKSQKIIMPQMFSQFFVQIFALYKYFRKNLRKKRRKFPMDPICRSSLNFQNLTEIFNSNFEKSSSLFCGKSKKTLGKSIKPVSQKLLARSQARQWPLQWCISQHLQRLKKKRKLRTRPPRSKHWRRFCLTNGSLRKCPLPSKVWRRWLSWIFSDVIRWKSEDYDAC